MALQQSQKQEIIKNFQRKELDTGSSQVQIALLTHRIVDLTEHFKIHKKDKHGQRGLVKLVNKRRKLLDYLKRKDLDGYTTLIGELGIRK
jgi:small subunit ribosomal protein S15